MKGYNAEINEGPYRFLDRDVRSYFTQLNKGELVRVRFAIPMTGVLTSVTAEVRWVKSARGRAAAGLEFEDLKTNEAQSIEAYVKLMQAIR